MSILDHGTDISDAIKIVIRKDEWIASRPWFADVHWRDGHIWRGWAEFYPTRKSLLAQIKNAAPNAEIIY